MLQTLIESVTDLYSNCHALQVGTKNDRSVGQHSEPRYRPIDQSSNQRRWPNQQIANIIELKQRFPAKFELCAKYGDSSNGNNEPTSF